MSSDPVKQLLLYGQVGFPMLYYTLSANRLHSQIVGESDFVLAWICAPHSLEWKHLPHSTEEFHKVLQGFVN